MPVKSCQISWYLFLPQAIRAGAALLNSIQDDLPPLGPTCLCPSWAKTAVFHNPCCVKKKSYVLCQKQVIARSTENRNSQILVLAAGFPLRLTCLKSALTDKHTVTGRVGEDDGISGRNGGVVCGGGWSPTAWQVTLAGGHLCSLIGIWSDVLRLGDCGCYKAEFQVPVTLAVLGLKVTWVKLWSAPYLKPEIRSSARWWWQTGSQSPHRAQGKKSLYLERRQSVFCTCSGSQTHL